MTAPLTPDLFPIQRPFADMEGARIKIVEDHREASGSIVCFERPDEGLFGVRIDIVHSPVMDSASGPPRTGAWRTIGQIQVEYLSLSEDAILAIKRSDEQGFQFEIECKSYE
jgi:hypothetical protein